jgi:hypothetical protein
MSSRLERLIEEALADAGVPGDQTKTASAEQSAPIKLASALEKLALILETPPSKKASSQVDSVTETDFNELLRQIFTGEDMDENTLKKREYIKRRIEQVGGLSAPTA